MTSKNSRTSSPVSVLPSDHHLLEEFKSCHNHQQHLISSPDDDSMFKSTHSRVAVPIDHGSGLLHMRPTERDGDDDEFFSLHKHNNKNDEPKNTLMDKKYSLPDEQSPEKMNGQVENGGGLGATQSNPGQMVPLLTFPDQKQKKGHKVKKGQEISDSGTLSLFQSGQDKIERKNQQQQWSLNWDHSSIHSQKSNFNSPPLLRDGSSADPSFTINSLAERTNELLSIESIQENYVKVFQTPSETSNGHYAVYIQPQNTLQEENFCWVILEVAYSSTYPLTMPDKLLLKTDEAPFLPHLKTQFGRPISDSNLKEMNEKAMQLAQRLIEQRQVVVYEIIEHVREALCEINKETSLYFKSQQQENFQKVIQKQLSGRIDLVETSSSDSEDEEESKTEKQQDEESKKSDLLLLNRQNSMYKHLNDQMILEGQNQIHDLYWKREKQINTSQLQDIQQAKFQLNEICSESSIPPQMLNIEPAHTQFSRYKSDFEETEKIGQGGAGQVFLARHKIDKNIYAIKKVRLFRKNQEENDRIKREVTVLSRLHNQHIVRYFQAWIEYINDPKEIEEFKSSDDELDYNDDRIAEHTSENDTNNYENEFASESQSPSRRARSLDNTSQLSYNDEDEYPLQDENDVQPYDYYEDEYDSESYSMYQDSQSYLYRHHKGKKRSKKDKQEKKSYYEKNYHKVNKVAQVNAKSYKAQSKNMKNSTFKPLLSNLQRAMQAKQTGIEVLYIQMEYCEGANLRNYIKSFHDLQSLAASQQKQIRDEKWKIFAQIVDALHYLHGIGLMHRDLKPHNIFLDKNNNVKLGDFGLATQHYAANCTKQDTKNSQLTSKQSNSGKSSKNKALSKYLGSKPVAKPHRHSTGIGTPLYMSPEQEYGNTGEYNYLADIYSLGLIFFEMWVGHLFTTNQHQSIAFQYLRQNNDFEEQFKQLIPPEAQILILRMIRFQPEERPSTTALLQRQELIVFLILPFCTSEQMPQILEDGTFKKFLYLINKHSSVESLQLINFLMKRQTPLQIDLGYEGYIPQQKISFDQNSLKQGEQVETYGDREIIIKSRLKRDFRSIFVLHGALDLDIPMLTPLQESSSILVFKRQNVVPPFNDRKKSQNSQEGGLQHQSSKDLSLMAKTRSLTGDLQIPNYQELSQLDIDYVKASYVKDFQLNQNKQSNLGLQGINNFLENNQLQRVTYHNIEAPAQLAFKLIDDTGIVLHLQMNLMTNFARYIARKPNQFIKRYHLGKVFRKNHSSQQFMQKSKAQETMEASFDIVSPTDELIYEAEAIKVCDQIAQKYQKEIGPYRIKISSSEIIDGILDECQVPFEKRHLLLKQLSTLENRNMKDVKRCLAQDDFIPQQNLERLREFFSIRGPLSLVESKIQQMKGQMKKPDRFKQVIERFKSLKNYLKYFSLNELEPHMKDQQQSAFLFDFGLILDNHLQYYSGLVFKLVLPNLSQQMFYDDLVNSSGTNSYYQQQVINQKNEGVQKGINGVLKDQKGVINPSFMKRQSLLGPMVTDQPIFKNNFTEETGYSTGKNTSAIPNSFEAASSMKQPTLSRTPSNIVQPIGRRQFLSRFETLAVGGRFDNQIAHYQPAEVPMAVGVRFFSQRFIQKIIRYEQKMGRENPSIETKPFDVYLVSHGDMTQEKMELLSDFWKSGIRADADFSNNFGNTEFNTLQNQSLKQKARFLITLKRQVFMGSGKMKVRDFFDLKNEKEREEHRDAIVDYIRQKLVPVNPHKQQ